MLQRVGPRDQHTTDLPVQVSENARRRITEALEQSLAPTTRVNYRSQWKKWETFADDNGYHVFPADPVHLADWITSGLLMVESPALSAWGWPLWVPPIARRIFPTPLRTRVSEPRCGV